MNPADDGKSDFKNGVRYGCHIELMDGEEPDGCVVDYGAYDDCTHGFTPSGRPRRSKWTCRYWQPIVSAKKARMR